MPAKIKAGAGRTGHVTRCDVLYSIEKFGRA